MKILQLEKVDNHIQSLTKKRIQFCMDWHDRLRGPPQLHIPLSHTLSLSHLWHSAHLEIVKHIRPHTRRQLYICKIHSSTGKWYEKYLTSTIVHCFTYGLVMGPWVTYVLPSYSWEMVVQHRIHGTVLTDNTNQAITSTPVRERCVSYLTGI